MKAHTRTLQQSISKLLESLELLKLFRVESLVLKINIHRLAHRTKADCDISSKLKRTIFT